MDVLLSFLPLMYVCFGRCLSETYQVRRSPAIGTWVLSFPTTRSPLVSASGNVVRLIAPSVSSQRAGFYVQAPPASFDISDASRVFFGRCITLLAKKIYDAPPQRWCLVQGVLNAYQQLTQQIN